MVWIRTLPQWNFAAVAVLFFGAAGSTAAQTPRPEALTVRDALGIARFADRNQLDLSPDGALVAFALQDHQRRAAERGNRSDYFDDRGVPRGHAATDVYVADARTGATRRLSDGRGSAWAPVWSPDGRYLAFYSDRDGFARVWVWEPKRDTILRLSDGIAHPFFGFEQVQWSPDGRRLLVKLLPEGMSFADIERLLPTNDTSGSRAQAARSKAVTARLFSYQPTAPASGELAPRAAMTVNIDSARSFLNAELSDLALIDVPTGRTHRLARRVRAMGYRFAPTGDRVAFSTRQPDAGTGMLVYNRYDIWVVDTTGSPARIVVPRAVMEYGLGFSWSPGGGQIAYASQSVQVVRAADGAQVRSFARDGMSFQHEYRPPLWLDDQTIVVAARDTLWRLSLATGEVAAAATPRERRLLDIVAPAPTQHLTGSQITVAASDRRSKRVSFQRVDLSTGKVTSLFDGNLAIGGTDISYQLDVSRDSRVIAFVAETGTNPPEVWLADAGFTRPRQLTRLHAQISRLTLGQSRLVDWTGKNGKPLQGALLLPTGYVSGKRYPLVVRVYGGSLLSGRVNRFGLEHGVDNLQLLATRGYAVLLPDTPLEEGTPMADLAAAVLPGVDSVIAMGVADPDRLAILGHSYGGYSALGIAVQSPRFRAVISSGGFSNLFSQYAEMREDGSVVGIGWSERGQGRMGAHPWDQRQRYVDNSPFFFLDRINAPVLLLHGAADRTVLRQRAEETFVGLRRLGKEVTLVFYDGEEHHPGTWSVENAADYWERIFDWLARHLAPRSAAASSVVHEPRH
jgi:dipeptidyl aminopeptidase/acylaminoacyl peptidase